MNHVGFRKIPNSLCYPLVMTVRPLAFAVSVLRTQMCNAAALPSYHLTVGAVTQRSGHPLLVFCCSSEPYPARAATGSESPHY